MDNLLAWQGTVQRGPQTIWMDDHAINTDSPQSAGRGFHYHTCLRGQLPRMEKREKRTGRKMDWFIAAYLGNDCAPPPVELDTNLPLADTGCHDQPPYAHYRFPRLAQYRAGVPCWLPECAPDSDRARRFTHRHQQAGQDAEMVKRENPR